MIKSFEMFLAVTACGLLLALVVVILRRRLQREYPFFFAYIVFSMLSAISLWLIAGHDKAYPYAYWVSAGLNAVFALFALNEAFYNVFYRLYSLWWFRMVFPAVVVVVSLVAVNRAIINPVTPRLLMSVIFYVNGAVSLLQVATFLVSMSLAVGLRARRRSHPYDIALGFAVSGIGDWTIYVLPPHPEYSLLARYVESVTYLCATLIWLWSFSGLESGPRPQSGGSSRPTGRRETLLDGNWKLLNYSRFMPE